MSPTNSPLRIVYFGSGAFGIPTLERLSDAPDRFDVALVVSQPDKPAGRRRTLKPTPAAQWAAGRGIDVVRCADVNAPETVERIAAERADVFVVIAFGQKMGPALLDQAFAMNLHGSLLPKYRGAAPIQRAVMNGDAVSGVSIITVASRMDAGDILGQRATTIGDTETAGELHDRLAVIGAELFVDVLDQFARGQMQRVEQDESQTTHASKLTKAEAWVDFSMDADRVRARINGLNPWPGCDVIVDGQRVRLRRAQVCKDSDAATDKPAGTHVGDGIIKCGRDSVRLIEVQAQGGRVMEFKEFARGRDWRVGAELGPA